MKLLYTSCHEVLEYDEVRLFAELGIDVVSTGAYVNPESALGKLRPCIPELTQHPEFYHVGAEIDLNDGLLPQDLIDWADTIVYMHQMDRLRKNWRRIRDKRVIFRSIGQMGPAQEQALHGLADDGLQIVRFSPREHHTPDFAGEATLIRFYKDPNEFRGYTGERAALMVLAGHLKRRGVHCMYEEIVEVVAGFPHTYYGFANEDLGEEWGGPLSFEEEQRVLREFRAFIYGGTWPAAYTLGFIEAWMTGIPVVAVGSQIANARLLGFEYYEVEDLIDHGINGFVGNSMAEMRDAADRLLKDRDLAMQVGQAGRAKAIEVFGKERIGGQWKAFLGV